MPFDYRVKNFSFVISVRLVVGQNICYRRMLRISRIFWWLPRCDSPTTLRLKDATSRNRRSRPTAATTPQPGRPSAMDTVATYTNTIETRIGTSLQLSDRNCKFPSHGFQMAYSEERAGNKFRFSPHLGKTKPSQKRWLLSGSSFHNYNQTKD